MTQETKPFETKAAPQSGVLSPGTDAKLEFLFDALILKALRSLENASLGAVLERLDALQQSIRDARIEDAAGHKAEMETLQTILESLVIYAQQGEPVSFTMKFSNRRTERV